MYGLMSQGGRDLLALQAKPKRTKRKRLSRRFRQRIFWRDGGKCVYCGNDVKFCDATMDHVTPLVGRGKMNAKENIVLSCRGCNNKKGALELETLDDLAPESLYVKFSKAYEDLGRRQGCYPEWIAAH